MKSEGERTHDRLRIGMRFLTSEATRARAPLSSRWLSGCARRPTWRSG